LGIALYENRVATSLELLLRFVFGHTRNQDYVLLVSQLTSVFVFIQKQRNSRSLWSVDRDLQTHERQTTIDVNTNHNVQWIRASFPYWWLYEGKNTGFVLLHISCHSLFFGFHTIYVVFFSAEPLGLNFQLVLQNLYCLA